MKKLDIETLIDRRSDSRIRRDEKAAIKMENRENRASEMVGELSSGKCYVYPVGGKYREGTRANLIAFLIRNKYA